MSKWIRRVLQAVAVLAILLLSCFGWLMYRLNGATRIMVWQIEEGGLTLTYFPLKNQATLLVGDQYARGSKRTWKMTDPGASKRLVGAIPAPSPEELFSRARVSDVDTSGSADCGPDSKYGLTCSSGAGLVNLYTDVTDPQRSNILWMLEYACETNADYCVFVSQVRDLAGEP
ncbi:MAG TPA: hypothetical protein PKK06_17150 [Phycisphaerae bacterium]|nr:hypothetical protein [Phycisphaerae bacterium]HNU46891.1 hypothetical protein [Phycisphaerae bacterium]